MVNETRAKSGTGSMLLSKIILVILSMKWPFVCKVQFSLFLLWQYLLNGASCLIGKLSVYCPIYVRAVRVLQVGSEIFPGGQHGFVVRHTGSRTNPK